MPYQVGSGIAVIADVEFQDFLKIKKTPTP